MSRGSLLLLLSLIAACSFAPPDGNGGTGGTVDGQVDDPNDRDGDGRANDVDNCPDAANPNQEDGDEDGVGDACDNCAAVKNPRQATLGFTEAVQRDHDGDGVGDECDLCPHLSSDMAKIDSDGDGIGDACDPEPNAANPKPYWNGFYDAPDGSWMRVIGGATDWEVALRDGKVGWRQKTLDGSRHQIVHMQRHDESFVQSSLVIEQMQPSTTTQRSATVTFGFERLSPPAPSQTGYYSCGMLYTPSGDINSVVVGFQRDDSFIVAETQSQTWSDDLIGKPIEVTGRGDRVGATQPNDGSSALKCDATNGTTKQSSMTSSAQRPDGQIGLRTFGMVAWFDYIFVVEPHAP